MAYGISMDVGFAGQLDGIGPSNVETRRALEALQFGQGLVRGNAKPGSDARLPMINQVVLTGSAALVASNSTSGSLAVTTIGADGTRSTATTAVGPVVFATDDATTLTALATAIAGVTGVKSAVADDANHKITVVAENDTQVVLSNFLTTGGAGQATWATANSTTDSFIGVALHEQAREMNLYTGVAQYDPNTAANNIAFGRVLVTPENDVNQGDGVYMRFTTGSHGSTLGAFRGGDDDSGTCFLLSRVRWANDIAATIAGPLEISLP